MYSLAYSFTYSYTPFKPTIISVVLFSFQIFFSFSVKIRYIFAVLADAEYLVFFSGFVNGLVMRDGTFVGKDVVTVGGEEDKCGRRLLDGS